MTSFENEIWVSAMRTYRLDYPETSGMCFKNFGEEWESQDDVLQPQSNEMSLNRGRHNNGQTLLREQFPEAACVFNKKHFKAVGEFVWFRGFMGIRGSLAHIFQIAFLGENGALFPVPVFRKDMRKQLKDDFYLVNWGQHNVCSFRPQESSGVEQMTFMHPDAPEIWDIGYNEFEIAVDSLAHKAPDIWIEPKIPSLVFMKGLIARQIIEAKLKTDLVLRKCRIVGT